MVKIRLLQNDIPAGKYAIVITSENTTRDLRQPISNYVENTLSPLFRNSFDKFKTYHLNLNKHEVGTIEIKKDRTLDFSYDFGYTFL
jgi:hypothetical protein